MATQGKSFIVGFWNGTAKLSSAGRLYNHNLDLDAPRYVEDSWLDGSASVLASPEISPSENCGMRALELTVHLRYRIRRTLGLQRIIAQQNEQRAS